MSLLSAEDAKPKPERKKKMFTPTPEATDSGYMNLGSVERKYPKCPKITNKIATPLSSSVSLGEKCLSGNVFLTVAKINTAKSAVKIIVCCTGSKILICIYDLRPHYISFT